MDQFNQMLNQYPWAGNFFNGTLRVLLIAGVVILCAKLVGILANQTLRFARKKSGGAHTSEREKRLATVVKLVETTLRVVLFGAAILMVLRELGLDITPLLTGAGIAGVAVGLGAQSLVKDVIAGFFILLEDQIRIGDVVRISGFSGAVERLDLRTTAIRDGDGTLHVIPNGEIKAVSNMTYDFSTAVVSFPLPYRADLKKASSVAEEVVRDFDKNSDMKSLLLGSPTVVGVTDFAHTHMTFQVTAKTPAHFRWQVERELRARLKAAFEAQGVALM